MTQPARKQPARKQTGKAPARKRALAPQPARVDPPVHQPTANAERGEHELELAGVTYRLRPTMGANIAIEEQTGKTLIELALAGRNGALTLRQVGVIAAEWIKAGAEDELTRHVSTDRIRELAYEQGLSGVIARLTVCLTDACTGGRTSTGEAKAGAAL